MPKVSVQIPGQSEDSPIFSNAVGVANMAGSVIINFGYIDPSDLTDAIELNDETDGSNETYVRAASLVKVALAPFTAKQLLKTLQDILQKQESDKDKDYVNDEE